MPSALSLRTDYSPAELRRLAKKTKGGLKFEVQHSSSEFHYIPCSRQNPEFLRINDPEIIGNGAAELRPFSGNAFA